MTGRVPTFRRQASDGTLESLNQELSTLLGNYQRLLHGNLELPVLDSRSELIQQSNLKVVLRRVRFDNADEDVPVSHGLGRFPRHWMACNPSGYARFARGQKSPDEKLLYIRCDTAGVEADFLIWAEAGGPTR